ncbi:MAG: GNAT family N-acetyltransferase [Tenericutes bacterium]|jgi:N-acetylglutamate synthase-like GNAT family acetyltransferase|nr:GNAT family N-acetyltransferase [Mycoplasmatota bacterium]
MGKITFIEDTDLKYNRDIIKNLHNYNKSQAGYREKEYQHFYVFEDESLLGACHTKMESDWCHVMNIYYQDIDILKVLVNDLKRYYESKVEGIQFSSILPERVENFKSIGFIEKGRLEDMPSGGENVFLLNTDFTLYETDNDYDKKSSSKPIDSYLKVMKKENKKLRKSLNFSSKRVDIQYVVLDDDKFIGGIYGNFQYDYLFINVLFVNENYRGQQIASKLMDMIEVEAARREVYNLYLTTFEFQALEFYKKRGYKKVMEIYDFPIGFKEFTVYKNISPKVK